MNNVISINRKALEKLKENIRQRESLDACTTWQLLLIDRADMRKVIAWKGIPPPIYRVTVMPKASLMKALTTSDVPWPPEQEIREFRYEETISPGNLLYREI